MRLIDADALRADYFVTSTTTNTPLYRYVSMEQIANAPTVEPASPWHRVEEELPEPNIQCLVCDDDNNCAVGYYRRDARAWDSPLFGWVERDDEYYEDGDLCRIGKVVAWMPIEPPKEEA